MISFLLFAFAVSGPTNLHDTRASHEKEVVGVVENVIDAVKNKNTEGILRYVSEGGISCVDDTIPRSKVAKDLNDKSSWLHTFLFDETAFSKMHADKLHPSSLNEVVMRSERLKPEIHFMKVKGEANLDWACAHLKSEKFKYKPELCFVRKEGSWFFTSSPYSCE